MVTSLWRDTTSGIHLLGSIHHLPRNVAQALPPQIRVAFDSSSVVAFEARNDRVFDQSVGMLPITRTLRDVVPSETYGRLSKFAVSVGLDLQHYANLRPFAIGDQLLRRALERLGISALEGLDSHLLSDADAAAKQVVELEDINYGFRRIREAGLPTELEYLRLILDSLPTLKEDHERLLEAWRTGDLRVLDEQHTQDMDAYPLVMKILQTERNSNWLPIIETLRSRAEGVIVVVGVFHLVGRGSLLDLMGLDNFEQL
jgi:uncharacterized protein YbaP (TraB family)